MNGHKWASLTPVYPSATTEDINTVHSFAILQDSRENYLGIDIEYSPLYNISESSDSGISE